MKELLIGFLIALIAGSFINGMNQGASSNASSNGSSLQPSAQLAASIQSVDEASFDEVVLASKTPVLVDFYTQACPHCQNMVPVLVDLSKEHPDLKIVKVDAIANPLLAQKYKVGPVPTFLVFIDGKEVESVVGEIPKEELGQLLVKHLQDEAS